MAPRKAQRKGVKRVRKVFAMQENEEETQQERQVVRQQEMPEITLPVGSLEQGEGEQGGFQIASPVAVVGIASRRLCKGKMAEGKAI